MEETINLPKEVIDSEWKDDIDYETYKDERTYISPDEVKKTTITRIKKSPIKLAIRNMVDWEKIQRSLSA
ncbi:hypothetical protein J6X04_00875 [Candidatus Saccharibacteria bacterium]|nr:hypothetical protein [Candidatus Saccharibacteria bacterium]